VTDRDLRPAIQAIDLSVVATYERVVTAELIASYAENSGDDHPIHTDAAYAARTAFGRRIAHGGILIGFMSTASTILLKEIGKQVGYPDISVGYDRIRFLAAVFESDVITATARICETQPERQRVMCQETCTNQDGVTVAVGTHVLKFVRGTD
jgi:3-hydroxybutyryl-CoA dehydratase